MKPSYLNGKTPTTPPSPVVSCSTSVEKPLFTPGSQDDAILESCSKQSDLNGKTTPTTPPSPVVSCLISVEKPLFTPGSQDDAVQDSC